MKRIILYVLLALGAASPTMAQKTLKITDVSKQTDVYPCADRKEWMAEFQCNEGMNLKFASSYHAGSNVDILSLEVDSVGNRHVYRLVFPTEGEKGTMSLNRRRLTVYCNGFDPLVMENFNASPKEKKTFIVEDLYQKLENPFYDAINKAAKMFSSGNYEDAKVQYRIAMETPEYTDDDSNRRSIDKRMADIDSILIWREKADNAYENRKFIEAQEYYTRILNYNPTDNNVNVTRQKCVNDQYSDCGILMRTADELFRNDHLEEAAKFYQRVIDEQCFSRHDAAAQLLIINKMLTDRAERAHFVTYEINGKAPIGFAIGKYNKKGFGGYFSMHVNAGAFKSLRCEPDTDLFSELDVSFGWTHKIYPPVWFHFGIGYAGCGQYLLREGAADKNPEMLEKDDYCFKWYNAATPEIGLAVKVWYITLRYTFQYRFALKSDYKDYMGTTRHFFGVGFCW